MNFMTVGPPPGVWRRLSGLIICQQSDTIAIDCHGTNHHIRNTPVLVRCAQRMRLLTISLSYLVRRSQNVSKRAARCAVSLCVFKREVVTVSIDLSGESIIAGLSSQGSMAPLKENPSGARLILRAGWGKRCGYTQLIDLCCGFCELSCEAAMMSFDIATGFRRQYWGF